MKKNLVNKFLSFRRIFTESKVNINRSMSYVAILNSGMILFLLLSKLQDYGIRLYLTKWFFPIFALSIVVMISVGYLDHKLGFHREEARLVSKRNPYMGEIIMRLDRVENELKKRK